MRSFYVRPRRSFAPDTSKPAGEGGYPRGERSPWAAAALLFAAIVLALLLSGCGDSSSGWDAGSGRLRSGAQVDRDRAMREADRIELHRDRVQQGEKPCSRSSC